MNSYILVLILYGSTWTSTYTTKVEPIDLQISSGWSELSCITIQQELEKRKDLRIKALCIRESKE